MKLISVVMPVKQWRDHTDEAVHSILAQTHSKLELLIVTGQEHNDAESRLPSDARIHCFQRPKPGIVSALNAGLTRARGEYVARMDDDDIAHPIRLETQLNYLDTNPDIGVCGTAVEFFSKDQPVGPGNQRYQDWLNSMTLPDDIAAQMFIESPLPHPTWMASRSIWEKVGAYREFDGPEDYDWLLRAWLLGVAMGKPTLYQNSDVMPAALLAWREHPNRLTYQDTRYSRQAFIELKASVICDVRSGCRLEAGRHIWIAGTGRNARYWCDALKCYGGNVRGFIDLDRHNRPRRKRHLPVITYQQMLTQRNDALIISAITNRPARDQLSKWFTAYGLKPFSDYILGG